MKGILFKPDMHLAIREDRKTVTRRLDHLKEINQSPDDVRFVSKCYEYGGGFYFDTAEERIRVNPRYKAGEVVYIKEAWRLSSHYNGESCPCYKLDNMCQCGKSSRIIASNSKWESPLFLPAKYARDFIQITDVRPERLQEITDDDAVREGIPAFAPNGVAVSSTIPRKQYAVLWDSINKDNPFASNPWVFRYEFKRVSRPVNL